MAEPFLGEIRMFSGTYAPRYWALCDGQILDIASYSSLFALIGTTYGGDGRQSFALPDLRGRVPIGYGAGPNLTNRILGEKSGLENINISINEMPEHNHLQQIIYRYETNRPPYA